ncbi:MAG: bifunctional methylenetetrahydrofolate dehydrogenase/methenyltetrahydrofolate cyclohydrolase FolD [Pseudomonadota bacterium]
MSTTIIDGKKIAKETRIDIAKDVQALLDNGKKTGLAVILVGNNPASHVYVKNKIKACAEVGIESFEYQLDESATYNEIEALILELNDNDEIDGILLQLPLPDHLSKVQEDLVQLINPEKDVDGLTITNAGKLILATQGGLIPCTPSGSLHLIKEIKEDLSGLYAVVIGRSNLFGKPMAQLLLQENCTVTTAHSRTKNIQEICKQADILVAAVGREKMVQSNWVKDGAIVIDVGINRMENGKLCGDVDFDNVKEIAGAITPVPGGVGPMTITYLLANTLEASRKKA